MEELAWRATVILLLFGRGLAGIFELVARGVVSFTLPGMIGYPGICLAGPIAWIAAAVPLAIAYFVVIKRMLREFGKQTLSGKTPLYH